MINLAPTGMIPTKAMTPYVPVRPDEIAEDALKCIELGASMLHIHARGEDENPTYKKEVYAHIISSIKEKNREAVIIVSTSGRTYSEFDKRSEVLELDGDIKPDMASLTLSSVNFNKIASINSPDMILKQAARMQERGIKPELEVFDLGMVNYAHYLIRKELITPPYYFNIILGNIAAAQAKLMHLGLIVSELPENSFWSVAGVGSWQKDMNTLGTIMGNGIRIGLEDNIWFNESKTVLATNYSLVERAVKIADILERPIASCRDVRQMLKLA
jgi:uncharacterized protein (DUF849 family)